MRKCVGHIGRIPVHDRGDDEVEAGGAVLLALMAAIDDTALPERADWGQDKICGESYAKVERSMNFMRRAGFFPDTAAL